MKKLMCIFLCLSVLAIFGTANAGLTRCHFAYYYDDVSKETFFSDIWERDFFKYKGEHASTDAKAFREYIESFHTWGCGSCYSGGTISPDTMEEAKTQMETLAETFSAKGHKINYTDWTP
jgi:hypothetical protein